MPSVQKRMRAMAAGLTKAEAQAFDKSIDLFLPEAAQLLMELAKGITVQDLPATTRDGKVLPPNTYTRPPDREALVYLINRRRGIPRQAPDPILDQLNMARTAFIVQQVQAGVPEATARELAARSSLREIEAEMWPKQFVTEEDQRNEIRATVQALNKNLLALTPEEFEAIAPGVKDAAGALERMKGRIGRDQAAIIADVMGAKEQADEDEEEEADE